MLSSLFFAQGDDLFGGTSLLLACSCGGHFPHLHLCPGDFLSWLYSLEKGPVCSCNHREGAGFNSTPPGKIYGASPMEKAPSAIGPGSFM